MADFVNSFWNWFIIIPTVGGIIGCFLLIRWMQGETRKPGKAAEPMGHVWDENLAELNNPLPRWWLIMFYVTLIFGIGYLLLYPGLGSFQGLLKWSQKGQYEQEVQAAEAKFGALFEQFSKEDIMALASNPEAQKMGESLYAAYCTACHGSDARGGPGFPNLRDSDWLYGSDPQAIKTTILQGRNAAMPAWKDALKEEGVKEVAQYVLSLSGREVDASKAAAGKQKFMTYCVACHGLEGKGNPALGAPNLTDNIWLYGGSVQAVEHSLTYGRQGKMPAHKEFLGEAKVHLLAAYVYRISHEQ